MPAAQKPVFVRCNLCELNYVKKGETLCAVCRAKEKVNDDEIDEMDLEFCPVCRTNYVKPDEMMCQTCLKERQGEDGIIVPKSEEDEWEKYLANNEDDFVEEDEEAGDLTEVDSLEDSDLELGSDLPLDDDIDDKEEELEEEDEEEELGDVDFDDEDDDEEEDEYDEEEEE